MRHLFAILSLLFSFFCIVNFASAQELTSLKIKKSSGKRVETVELGEKIKVKLIGVDSKIKGTMASSGILVGKLKSVYDNGFQVELDSSSLLLKDRGESLVNVELNSVEYIKAFSQRRKTGKILMMTIPSAGVITMLFVPYGIMPIAVLSPIWVPTIIIGALMSKYEKFKIQNGKWVIISS